MIIVIRNIGLANDNIKKKIIYLSRKIIMKNNKLRNVRLMPSGKNLTIQIFLANYKCS